MFCHASAIHPTAEARQARYGLSGAIPVKEKKRKRDLKGFGLCRISLFVIHRTSVQSVESYKNHVDKDFIYMKQKKEAFPEEYFL